MNVTDAVLSRRSIRSFLNKTVEDDLIKELLEKASYAASGGNLQPWEIFFKLKFLDHSILNIILTILYNLPPA